LLDSYKFVTTIKNIINAEINIMGKEYNPPMHSAEHIMNRTMVIMFGCGRSFSSHLNADKSKCDYHFTRDITDAEAKELEARVNEQIGKNLPVYEDFVSWEEASKLVDVTHLPESADRNAQLRLIRVGDYDVCACIGQHVNNTSEIGTFSLISHSYTEGQDGSDGVLRLRFKLVR